MTTKIIAALALASVIATSAFADGSAPQPDQTAIASTQPAGLTRAQVRAELVAIEKAGYTPAGEETNYPVNVQAAEARIAQNEQVATATATVPTVAATAVPTVATATPTAAKARSAKKFSFLRVVHSLPHPSGVDDTKSIYFGG
jgi:hypothetical protein